MKRIIPIILVAAGLLQAEDTKDIQKNLVDIQPLGFISGVSGSYTRLLGERVGIQAEGYVTLWDFDDSNSSGGSFALLSPIYRRKKESHWGMSAPYIAPFVRYTKSELDVTGTYEVNGSKITDFSMESLYIGTSFGRRWIFNSGFNLGFRAGYGIPVMYETDHGSNPNVFSSDDWKTGKTFGKVLGGLDIALQVGFAF